MSTLKLPIKAFAAIASTLRYTPELSDKFPNWREKYLDTAFKEDKSSKEDHGHRILCFAERLYIGNRLAHDISYSVNPILIKRLEQKQLEGAMLSNAQLFKTLKLVRYNVRSNAGKIMVGAEDWEKLNGYINLLAEKFAMGALEVAESKAISH